RRSRSLVSVPQDRCDPRVCVLHVVDGILVRLLAREVDVDVDRLVGAARDEVPARRVDADLLDQLAQEDDVAAALRSLARLAALDDVHELVDDHLHPAWVLAAPLRPRLPPPALALM